MKSAITKVTFATTLMLATALTNVAVAGSSIDYISPGIGTIIFQWLMQFL